MKHIVPEKPGNIVDYCEKWIMDHIASKVADLEKVFLAEKIQEKIYSKSMKIVSIPF